MHAIFQVQGSFSIFQRRQQRPQGTSPLTIKAIIIIISHHHHHYHYDPHVARSGDKQRGAGGRGGVGSGGASGTTPGAGQEGQEASEDNKYLQLPRNKSFLIPNAILILLL